MSGEFAMITQIVQRNFLTAWLLLAAILAPSVLQAQKSGPNIISQPKGGRAVLGEQFSLSVDVTGAPPFVFQWRLNGVVVPGAKDSQLVIPKVLPGDFGEYTVLIADENGVVRSDPAPLGSTYQLGQVDDSFGKRPSFESPSGLFRSSNANATKETGEPDHAGKPGGKSVWINWNAPGKGIATFRTRGSSFDTLLAVYTGNTIDKLTPITADDDSDGNGTSIVRFNTDRMPYAIAIDGQGGVGGEFILEWSWQQTDNLLPVILTQPDSQTVPPGAPVQFMVVAQGVGLRYQWYFGEKPISGATGSLFTINKVKAQQVGLYQVEITSETGSKVMSRSVALEIGTDPGVRTEDKFEDVFLGVGSNPGKGSAPQQSSFTSVSAGIPGTQIFSSIGSSTESSEPFHGGAIGGASRWFYLKPLTNGVMVIDTIGSDFDTVLSVYTGSSLFSLTLLAGDNNGAPDGVRSRVSFNAVKNVSYYVAVDGVLGASGNVSLNYILGNLPVITVVPTNQTVRTGTNVTMVGAATGTPAPTFQWRRNGVDVPGATGASLVLNNVTTNQTASYSLVASNGIGSVSSGAGLLTVTPRVQFGGGPGGGPTVSGGFFMINVSGGGIGSIVVEGSTNLVNWIPIFTNSTPGGTVLFSDPISNGTRKFYRARETP